MKTTDPRRLHVAIWTLPNGEEARVTVSYPTMNGLQRAYTLHVQPIERREHTDGVTIECYVPSRGYRYALESAPRYSRKRLEALAADPYTFERARRMFDQCAAECAPTLPGEEPWTGGPAFLDASGRVTA